MAAPVGGQIFSEILPYLEVVKGKKEEIQEKNEVEVPNVVGMSIQEAEKVLKECGLELELNKDCENELNENETNRNETNENELNRNDTNVNELNENEIKGNKLKQNESNKKQLNKTEEFVKRQTPSSGIKVYEGSHVFVDI